MDYNNFNAKDIIFSLDIGTRSIIGTVGIVKEKKYQVICEKYLEHEERAMIDGQIHDVNLVAQVVNKVKTAIEEEIGITLTEVSIAAAGRFLRTIESKAEIDISDNDDEVNKEMIRTLELSAVKHAEEEINKTAQGKLYCVGYSVKNYYLNKYLIANLLGQKGESIEVEVIATFLPRSVVDSLYSVMNKVNLRVINLTLEPIAAMEAAIPKKLRLLNIALVDIGAGTSDIAISSKETISAYGMVPIAGDEITEAIVQEFLVDFNTAEEIKRQCLEKSEITYTDIMGLENNISSEVVLKSIESVVKKLSSEISTKIVELNGNKSPSAVFLVGGGAHTPGLIKEMSGDLNMPEQRIGIKDRNAVIECVSDNSLLGSAGVTVLGIALSAMRTLGNDFIDVTLNSDPVTLFNSHKHTVMDVVLQAGINPNLFMAKNGKSVRFTYNGCKRIVFGDYGKNAVIKVNEIEATLETEVSANDKVVIEYAQNGNDAQPKLADNIKDINSISLFVNDEILNIIPVILVNGEEQNIEYIIKNGDAVEVFLPCKVRDFKKYVLKKEVKIFVNEEPVEDEYVFHEGQNIVYREENLMDTVFKEDDREEENVSSPEDKNLNNHTEIETVPEKVDFYNKGEGKSEKELTLEENLAAKTPKEDTNLVNMVADHEGITVIVNDEEVKMAEKDSYVLVDIFNYIDFDLTVPKGSINIVVNGQNTSAYTSAIKDGDVIKVFWS